VPTESVQEKCQFVLGDFPLLRRTFLAQLSQRCFGFTLSAKAAQFQRCFKPCSACCAALSHLQAKFDLSF